jgi:hypothetical protein
MPTQSWGDPPQDYSGQRNAVPAPARIEAASWGVPVCPLLSRKGIAMNLHMSLTPLVSLIAGYLAAALCSDEPGAGCSALDEEPQANPHCGHSRVSIQAVNLRRKIKMGSITKEGVLLLVEN